MAAEAQPLLLRRVNADVRLYGKVHPKVAMGYRHLGRQLLAMAEHNATLGAQQEALEHEVAEPIDADTSCNSQETQVSVRDCTSAAPI